MPISFNIPIGGEKRRTQRLEEGMALGARDQAMQAKEQAKNDAKKFKALVDYAASSKLMSKEEAMTKSLDELDGTLRGMAYEEEKNRRDRELSLREMAAKLQKKGFKQGQQGIESMNDLAAAFVSSARKSPEALQKSGFSPEVISAVNTLAVEGGLDGKQLDYLLQKAKAQGVAPGTATSVITPEGENIGHVVAQNTSGAGTFYPKQVVPTPGAGAHAPSVRDTLSTLEYLDKLDEKYGLARDRAGDDSLTGPERRQARQEAEALTQRKGLLQQVLGMSGGVQIGARPRQAQSSTVNEALPEIYQPMSLEEMRDIPRGARYINPADGRTYTKN